MNRRPVRHLLLTLLAVNSCVVFGGCYRRVVRAEGVSGDYKVYEPNLSSDKTRVETETENFLFGEQKPVKTSPR